MLKGLPRVFIGHLPRDVRRNDIENLLSDFPDVKEIMLKNGFGFVEFDNLDSAERCVRDFSGQEFMGGVIRVELARGTRRERGDNIDSGPSRYGGGHGGFSGGDGGHSYNNKPKGYAVMIHNCPDIAWQNIKDHFRPFGKLIFADVFPSRKEGIVEFESYRDAKEAISKLDKTRCYGDVIRLRLVDERDSRSRSRSQSRSDSRHRRHRSRSPKRSIREKERYDSHEKERVREFDSAKYSDGKSRSRYRDCDGDRDRDHGYRSSSSSREYRRH